jgi:hypothetical protein
LSVIPNPSRSLLTIMAPGRQIETLSLADISGAVVYTGNNYRGSRVMTDVGSLPAGNYFYTITTTGHEMLRGKLVVAH